MSTSKTRKPPLLGIPPTVKVSDIAERQGLSARERMQQATMEMVSSQLHKPAPKAASGIITDPRMEVNDSWATMPIDLIGFYENNPRKANNAAYLELKESIRVNGILQPITITKRPGDSKYILFAGGNTRLSAIKELWAETGDPKFKETRVIIKTWRGEAAVMLAHMAENTQRNDMTFWDKANGTLSIKKMLEDELGKELSLRDLVDEMKVQGVTVSSTAIAIYLFAIKRLALVGPFLSLTSLQAMQPSINQMLRLHSLHEAGTEDEFFDSVIQPVCELFADKLVAEDQLQKSFPTESFIKACNEKLALHLGVSTSNVKKMLAVLDRFKNEATLDDLKRVCGNPAQENVRKEMQGASAATYVTSAEPAQKSEIQTTEEEVTIPAFLMHQQPVGDNKASEADGDDPVSNNVFVQEPTSLLSMLEQLIAKAGILSCHVKAERMPLGFYVGFPKDGPLDLKDNPQARQVAWWIVAMASGQFNSDLCKNFLPPGDPWRSLILEEGDDLHTLDELDLAIQNNIGGNGEFLPIPWLLDQDNQIGSLCLEILTMLKRGQRSQS